MIVKNIPGKLLSSFISIFSDTKILRQLKGDRGFSIKTDCKFFDEVFTLKNKITKKDMVLKKLNLGLPSVIRHSSTLLNSLNIKNT